MKRYIEKPSLNRFSCLAIIMTMLLFGSSNLIEASAAVGKAAVKSARNALGRELLEAGMKRMDDVAFDLLSKKMATEVASSGVEAGARATMLKSLSKNITKNIDDLAKVGLKMDDIGINSLTKLRAVDDFADIGQKALTDQAGAVKSLKKLGYSADDANVIVHKMVQTDDAMKAFNAVDATKMGKIKKAFTGSSKATRATEKAAEKVRLARLAGDETVDMATRQAARKSLKNFSRRASVNFAMDTGMKGMKFLSYAGATMVAAVLFMVPSIFQSMYLAEQMENAMLKTYLPPIKFGNIVLQMPDSVVNMANPAMSQFIYYGIPVDTAGQKLSDKAKSMYPGVSGPTQNNKLSKQVENGWANALSFGSEGEIEIKRYNLDAQALANLPVFVSYSDQSWMPWASNGIPDAAFTQKMVNLNTGYVLYADGTSQGALPADLIGPKANMDTVQSFMGTQLGKLTTAGNVEEFREYVQTVKSEKAGKVHGPITDLFDCGCLLNNNGILSSDTIQSCSPGNRTKCLLTKSLNQLSAGLVINSQGQMMTADQDLATEVANGALGQVIPVQGLGAKFDEVLQMFPGAQQEALANSGALTVNIGSDLSSISKVKIQGADPDNYTAKGVYVYQCKNTPLAKILKNQSGGSASMNSQITDYIVFLDSDLNQVPMMAPVQNLDHYGFVTMGLNPTIKYFSTLIGSFDENGSFNFVPQLNIQSPAALVAKGLPASFPPLYSLQAANGSLAVNYNQNLTSAIGGIVQGLMNDPKLGQQFRMMQSAMLSLLGNGPYGQYDLQPVPTNMQPVIGGTSLALYTGFNGYPVSQDEANSSCSDVLIPLSAQGKTVTLPSNNVVQYYGLVTDLTYTVLEDGSLFVDIDGFDNSPLTASGSINQAQSSQYYWVDKLTAMGQGSDSQFMMPSLLIDFIVQARSEWINWVKGLSNSGLSIEEFMGIQVPGTANLFMAASEQALKHGLYVYTYSPSTSESAPDYFVLTNSLVPQVSDASLGKMSAKHAEVGTNMLSIVSGLLYDASGNQVRSGSGAAYTVDSKTLLQSLHRANSSAFSDDLKAKLNISSGKAAAAAMAMVYPFQFADLQLGLYQADINSEVYLYFDAAGAGASEDFEPSNYFVTIDSYTNPSNLGTKLSSATQFVVSLVSGKVYGRAGVVATASDSIMQSIINSLSPQWRSGVTTQIKKLTVQLAEVIKNDAKTTAEMNATPVPNSGIVTFPQSKVTSIIYNLASQDYLVEPYGMLKQDPVSGVYVAVSPANLEETQFMYTFFNVPSTMLNAQGDPIRVGAMYDEQGNLLRAIKGIELASMMQQHGIAIDSTGTQFLGANNSLPILELDKSDRALKPGMSGKSMICSNHDDFPSYDIVSPISYQNSQFYFYYNIFARAYYAMEVIGSDVRYIDMAGGCVYNLDGSPRIAENPVAMNSNGDITDLFLPYINADGFVQAIMKNAVSGGYSDFVNLESEFQQTTDPATNNPCGMNSLLSLDDVGSAVNVAQMPFPDTLTELPDLSMTNQYNVYFDGAPASASYTINANYQWQNLQILPIDMTTRALLNPLPADRYSSAGLISSKNGMHAMVFEGQFYSGAKHKKNGSYIMQSGSSTIVVSMQMDKKTNTKYVQVVVDDVIYNYQSSFLKLSTTELLNYRGNVWQSEIVADVTGNVLLEKYITIDNAGNLQLVPVSIKSVINVPVDSAEKSALSSNLGNVLQDRGNSNFMAPISSTAYPYFDQDGYVDLENGVLFDLAGMLVGYTLQYVDFMKLLSQLNVAVIRDAQGKAMLTYRAPMGMPVNSKLSSLSSSYKPGTATQKSSYSSPLFASSVKNSVNVESGNASGAEIAKLERENVKLQVDILKRQKRLKKESADNKKQVLKNAITMNNQQIALNNEAITELRGA